MQEYQDHVESARVSSGAIDEFPERLITAKLHNTWHDTAESVINNWVGKVYQVTSSDRKIPFMDSIDPDNPLDL